MKIGLLQNFDQVLIDKLIVLLPEHTIIKLDPKSESILNEVKDIDVLIGANASDELINSADKLKLFHVPWVGLDRINFNALQKKKIIICNSKWNNRIVAEYALTLLLSAIKHLIPIHNDFSKGSWKMRTTQSRLLTNSSVLLIGFGSICIEIAKLLQPFTKNVLALRNNPDQSSEEEKHLVSKIIGWDQYLDEIKSIDFIINSLPLTDKTVDVINPERIKAMKQGAYFVNVGRGKTVHEQALFEALQTNHLAGAAIDVWYNYKSSSDKEPFFPSNYPFQELPNVIMSPHRAATFADTSSDLLWSDIVFNVTALTSNKPLRNVISYDKRY